MFVRNAGCQKRKCKKRLLERVPTSQTDETSRHTSMPSAEHVQSESLTSSSSTPTQHVQTVVESESHKAVLQHLTACVLNLKMELEQWTQTLHVSIEPHGRPRRVANWTIAVRNNFHIRPSTCQAQFAQFTLENAVHFGSLIHFLHRVVNEKLGFLRDLQGHCSLTMRR